MNGSAKKLRMTDLERLQAHLYLLRKLASATKARDTYDRWNKDGNVPGAESAWKHWSSVCSGITWCIYGLGVDRAQICGQSECGSEDANGSSPGRSVEDSDKPCTTRCQRGRSIVCARTDFPDACAAATSCTCRACVQRSRQVAGVAASSAGKAGASKTVKSRSTTPTGQDDTLLS